MTRRRGLILVGALVAVSLAGGAVIFLPPLNPLERNLSRVQVGMPKGEVRAIMGLPDHTSAVVAPTDIWIIDESHARVVYKDGVASYKRFFPGPTLLDSIRAWLGW
jgi:hypothetical protein